MVKDIADINWYFEKRNSGKKFSDGTDKNFKNSFESLIRESIQNSNDARLRAIEDEIADEDEPCKMTFHSILIKGEERASFLTYIDDDNILSNHLKATKKFSETIGNKNITRYFDPNNDEQFSIFTIHDFNTIGLTGKDIPELDDKDQAFSALCRDAGLSDKGNITAKGGAWGMGKSVFWKFSKFNTVLFLSYTDHPNGGMKYRLFGLADLGFHKIKSREYDGSGQFGLENQDNDRIIGGYAESSWTKNIDEFSFLPKEIRDARRKQRGTSIMILGLEEMEIDEPKYMHDLGYEIYKWYWPLILNESLKVFTESSTYKREMITIANAPRTILPFIKVMQGIREEDDAILKNRGIIKTEFPSLLNSPNKRKLTGYSNFFFIKINSETMKEYGIDDFNEKDFKYVNHTAWMRGARSIIKYYKKNNPIGSDKYFGIILAGEAAFEYTDYPDGDFSEFDNFLRFAETPAHDEWNYKKSQLKERYGATRGASTSINAILKKFKNIQGFLHSSLIVDIGLRPPSGLQQLLPTSKSIGNGGKIKPKTRKTKKPPKPVGGLLVDVLENEQHNDGTIIQGVSIERKMKVGKWKLKVLPVLLDENFKKIGYFNPEVEIENLSTDNDILANDIYKFNIKISKIPIIFKDSIIGMEFKEVQIDG